jgi:hypothetical protein
VIQNRNSWYGQDCSPDPTCHLLTLLNSEGVIISKLHLIWSYLLHLVATHKSCIFIQVTFPLSDQTKFMTNQHSWTLIKLCTSNWSHVNGDNWSATSFNKLDLIHNQILLCNLCNPKIACLVDKIHEVVGLTCPHPKEQHRQAYLCVSEVDKVS